MAMLLVLTSVSLIACTDDSLAEAEELQPTTEVADGTDGEDGHIDPEEEPPGD